MNWANLTTVFLLATFKFMFAPSTGSLLNLPFWETYFASVIGGTVSAFFFYFLSELIIKRSHNKKIEKNLELERQGLPIIHKKKFTKTNRFVVRLKWNLGMYGICFWAPFLLSVPIGSMVVAKFYGKLKKTFLLIIVGMFINAMVMCLLSYLIF